MNINRTLNRVSIALAVIALAVSIVAMIISGHARHCTGHKTGKCSWAWCSHYDGSDSLHDFNF